MTDQTDKNRMVLLLIAGIPVTVILAATWLWWFVVRGDLDLVGLLGTANRGDLVQPPRRFDEVGLFDPGGRELRYGDLEPRWTMVVPASGGACDESCEHTLYLTRQIHVAMGKEFNRIRRLYISDTPVAGTALTVDALSDRRPAPDTLARLLETEHQKLQALTVDPRAYATLFPEQRANPGTWYLVDPAGWLMMSYNSEVNYKDVIADLKFLLKNSSQ